MKLFLVAAAALALASACSPAAGNCPVFVIGGESGSGSGTVGATGSGYGAFTTSSMAGVNTGGGVSTGEGVGTPVSTGGGVGTGIGMNEMDPATTTDGGGASSGSSSGSKNAGDGGTVDQANGCN